MLVLAGGAHTDALDDAKAAAYARMTYRHYVSTRQHQISFARNRDRVRTPPL